MTSEESRGSTDRKRKPASRTLWIIGLAVAVIGGSIWVWEEVLEDRLIPKRWGVVEAGAIYRSGQLSPTLIERTLQEHGIQLVVSLCPDEAGNKAHDAERQAVLDLGIDRDVYPLIGDGTGDIANYAKAIAAMVQAKRQGRPVLLHCAAGAYRTGGVVAAYRMLVEGAPPADAWAEMRRYDWDRDNPILPDYLNEHMAELAEQLVVLGVIDKVPDPLPVFGR